MIKRRLKSYVVPVFLLLVLIGGTVVYSLKDSNNIDDLQEVDFVSDTIINDVVPVIKEENKMINPYNDSNISIGKYYYDYKSKEEDQEKALVFYDNTYIQNSGIDFVSKNTFDVVSVLGGTITNVKEDELLGKIVEIKHDNDYISVYQSLSEVSVKKDDKVSQGEIIGKSGTNELDREMANHLHFELYKDGEILNPLNYLNKEIKQEKE